MNLEESLVFRGVSGAWRKFDTRGNRRSGLPNESPEPFLHLGLGEYKERAWRVEYLGKKRNILKLEECELA